MCPVPEIYGKVLILNCGNTTAMNDLPNQTQLRLPCKHYTT